LGAPDDAAESDVRFLPQQLAHQVLERRSAGEGIGVGVVVRQDHELAGTIEGLEQTRQRSAIIIVGAANRHRMLVAAPRAPAETAKLDTVSPTLSTPSYAVRQRAARSAAPAARRPARMPSSKLNSALSTSGRKSCGLSRSSAVRCGTRRRASASTLASCCVTISPRRSSTSSQLTPPC